MHGTVMVSDGAFEQSVMNVMYGLWNDGFRKQILINNHTQQNEMEKAVKRFVNAYQLPGFSVAVEWHRAVREFFETGEHGGTFETRFVHADEVETSLGLLVFPEMVNMDFAHPNTYKSRGGHTPRARRHARSGCREGQPGAAQKARRPVVAICECLTLLPGGNPQNPAARDRA